MIHDFEHVSKVVPAFAHKRPDTPPNEPYIQRSSTHTSSDLVDPLLQYHLYRLIHPTTFTARHSHPASNHLTISAYDIDISSEAITSTSFTTHDQACAPDMTSPDIALRHPSKSPQDLATSDIEVENDEGGLFNDISVKGLDGIEDGGCGGCKESEEEENPAEGGTDEEMNGSDTGKSSEKTLTTPVCIHFHFNSTLQLDCAGPFDHFTPLTPLRPEAPRVFTAADLHDAMTSSRLVPASSAKHCVFLPEGVWGNPTKFDLRG